MPSTHEPTLRKPGQGRTIAVVGDVYRFLATGEETNGKYALFEAVVSPGGSPPPHVHSREEEGFYIGNKPAKMLISVAPAGLDKMFIEVGVQLPEGATAALPPTKEEIDKLLAIAPSYGIQIFPPPN